jgi:ABC transporter substrate binding protein
VKRREFITLLGGTAAWPLAAGAQQGERMRRVGVLAGGGGEDDPDMRARVGTLLQALAQLGWTDGRNVRIDTRWPAANADNIRRHAAELTALKPDVIVAGGTSTAAPLLQATRTVPIVFVGVADPVGAGLVNSLARPGGNATGFMQFEYGLTAKWPELLKEIAPGVSSAPESRRNLRDRAVRYRPVCGIVGRGGGEFGRPARHRRDRACRDGTPPRGQRWSDRDGGRPGGGSSRSHHQAGGLAQAPRGLLSAALCR